MDDANKEIKNKDEDPESMKTKLYVFDKNSSEDSDNVDLEYAVNFTMALMQASLVTKLSRYSHLINLYRPQVKNRHILDKPVRSLGDEETTADIDQFHKIMVCTFVYQPSKDANFGSDIYDDLENVLKQKGLRPRHMRSRIFLPYRKSRCRMCICTCR